MTCDVETIKKLVQKKCNIKIMLNSYSSFRGCGDDFLQVISSQESADIIKLLSYLKDHGFDINYIDPIYKKPLLLYIVEHLMKTYTAESHVKLSSLLNGLVQIGANINLTDFFDETLLHKAIKNKYPIDVIKLLIECGTDITLLTKEHETFLHFFSCYHHDDNVRILLYLLLEHPNIATIINTQETYGGATPLHRICRLINFSKLAASDLCFLLDTMCSKGACMDIKNKYGQNILHSIVLNDDDRTTRIIMDWLWEKDQNLFKAMALEQDNNGATPLELAAKSSNYNKDHWFAFRKLLGLIPELAHKASKTGTPLAWVAQYGPKSSIAISESLCSHLIDHHKVNIDQQWQTEQGTKKICDLLEQKSDMRKFLLRAKRRS